MKIENFTKEQNELIDIALRACGVDCVLTFKGEGRYVTTLLSNAENEKGALKGSRDVGLCQLNWQFHFNFIFDLSKSPYFSKKTPKQIEQLKHSHKWNDRTTYNIMRKEFYRMYDAKEFSKDFLNSKVQMNYCIGVWNDAKKKKKIETTFYAYNNLKDPKKRANAMKEFSVTYK